MSGFARKERYIMKGLFKNCWTIPNLLTVIRVFLAPVFAYLFLNEKYIWAVAVLFFSGLSDFLDGKIARAFNQVSELGKVLDPVADKITQITLAVLLFIKFNGSSNKMLIAYSWIFLVFLIKEVIMVIGGGVLLLMNLRPSPAVVYGKIATFVFYAVMILLIAFAPEFGAFREIWEMNAVLLIILVAVSAILTIVAFLSYLPGTIKQFKTKENPVPKVKNENGEKT